jgi:molybdate transport system substrate-binding protein
VRRFLLAALVVLSFLPAACGDDDRASSGSTDGAPGSPAPARGEITVLAAASLTESFTALAAAFRGANPEARVTLSFASSSSLATQINQGAPADVFAAADTATMDRVSAANGAGTLGTPVAFATNTLQIIVARGNPKGIASLADLTRPGVVHVAAAPSVPIGAYAQQALRAAGVTAAPKSLEADVKAVVAKVTLGEADAGIVYATDVLAAGSKAQGVAIPAAQNVVVTYPIAVIKGARNTAGAQAFVGFVTSAAGQGVLASYGFTPR